MSSETELAMEEQALKTEAETQAKEHVTKNLRLRNDAAQACIDGGTSADQLAFDGVKSDTETSLMKRPGGSAGLSMILGAFGFSPEEAFVHIRGFLESEGITYSWHTDKHVHNDEGQFEGVQPNGTLVQNLDRNHAEGLILLVYSDKYTVNPLGQDGKQAFVYDVSADNLLLEKLASYLESKGLDDKNGGKITKDRLMEVRDHQDGQTLGLLASSQGKSMVKVTITDTDSIEYEYIGKAPKIEDGHSGDHKCTGCGHCQAAIDNSEKYRLASGWAEQLFKYISGELLVN